MVQNEELLNDEKIQSEIEKKVAEIKAADSKLKRVFPIMVLGDEDDSKGYYVGYFKQPPLPCLQ